jgi:hypothetical protein
MKKILNLIGLAARISSCGLLVAASLWIRQYPALAEEEPAEEVI